MAGRTSASTGIIVTIVVLSLLTLGLFVGFAVMLNKNGELKRRVASAEEGTSQIVGAERNRDDVRTLTAEAVKSEQRTLVNYLMAQRDALVQRISGDKRDTLATIEGKLKSMEGVDGSLLTTIRSLQGEVTSLTQARDAAEAARQQAVVDLQNEAARIATMQQAHRSTLQQLNETIGAQTGDSEAYRRAMEEFRVSMTEQLERARTASEESQRRLADQIGKLTEEKLVLEAQLAKARGDRNATALKPDDEAALVDGAIIGINEADGSVVLNLGRQQRMVLGMTFAVYSSPSSLKADAEGNLPRGKATLEVISVGDLTSTARVTSELRGNPVVRGDVIANAAYDPRKVYKFVVYGNFDTDRDGLATQGERNEVISMIRTWGGEVTDDLQGDADFLVLGLRPVLPPRPDNNAPFEVVQEFQRRFQEVERYDTLYRNAGAVGVPVLNENRFYTLVGKQPAALRRRAGNQP